MPVLLDLFCGAGGAAAGYHNAGFDVFGVDLCPQPRFPFPYRFVQEDAMKVLEEGFVRGIPLHAFDAIHASPPCQSYSKAMRHFTQGYPELIAPVIAILRETGIAWVVENVIGSDLPSQLRWDGQDGIDEGLMLCGSMFGLRVQRHRLFQTSFACPAPGYCDHSARFMNPHNAGARKRWREILGPDAPIERTWREEMGVGWMDAAEGRESIPPVYAEHIGRHLLEAL